VARFAAEERQFILAAARRALFDAVTSVAFSPPLVPPPSLEAKLAEQRGCFVTLTKGGLLRGCIGQVVPRDPLFQVAMENVRNAALFDPRFQPIQAEEVEAITIEISILTEPQAVAFASPEDLLDKLHPNEDGVWLKIGSRSATFLPQVWAQVPGKLEFLNLLARKAGCHASAWRDTDATVALYQVEAFAESNGSALHN
jgi:AmmeMemoRadiSam system protein A